MKERINGYFLTHVRRDNDVPAELLHLQVLGNFSWELEIEVLLL